MPPVPYQSSLRNAPELLIMEAIFWFLFAMVAVVVQIYTLPVASSDQSISVTVIFGILAILGAPALAVIFGALRQKICMRPEKGAFGRILCGLLAMLHVLLMLAVVGSPFIYFAYTTRAEFNAYPATRELPIEKVLVGNTCDSPPLFALVSDTHITDNEKTLEGKTDGHGKLQRTLSAIRNICPKLLIVSGDLTDRGENQEWDQFGVILRDMHQAGSSRRAGVQVLLVPGNHDLQGTPYDQAGEIITKGFGRTQDENLYTVPYLMRKRQFLMLAQTEGVLKYMGVRSPAEFSQQVDEVHNEANAAKKNPVMFDLGGDAGAGTTRSKPSFAVAYPKDFDKKLENAQQQFDSLFPMIHEDMSNGVAIVLLNSSAHLTPGASMGLGSLGAAQIKRLENYILELTASKRQINSLVVVLHHAPLRRETDVWSWVELKQKFGDSSIWAHTFLALDISDAQKVDSLLDNIAQSRKDIQVVLVHGHRHSPGYLGRTASGVLVVEASGLIEDFSPGFWAAYQDGGKLIFKWLSLTH